MKVIDISDWDSRLNDMLRGRNEHELYDMGYFDALDEVDDWMDAQPTITIDDLRPKGQWIVDEILDNGTKICHCSECLTGEAITKNLIPLFCWKCGADMRGGGEDA